jgi:hypothetical protein
MASGAFTIMTAIARGSAKTTGVNPTLLSKGDGAAPNRWPLKGG